MHACWAVSHVDVSIAKSAAIMRIRSAHEVRDTAKDQVNGVRAADAFQGFHGLRGTVGIAVHGLEGCEDG
jgi:hypothetical protein